jgi:hypothetical protein
MLGLGNPGNFPVLHLHVSSIVAKRIYDLSCFKRRIGTFIERLKEFRRFDSGQRADSGAKEVSIEYPDAR